MQNFPVKNDDIIEYMPEDESLIHPLIFKHHLQLNQPFSIKSEFKKQIEAHRIDTDKELVEGDGIKESTINDIEYIIRRFNNNCNNSLGSHRISNHVMRRVPSKDVFTLKDVTNAVLKLNHFPQTGNNTYIIVICKSNKNQRHPKSYKPICLTHQ